MNINEAPDLPPWAITLRERRVRLGLSYRAAAALVGMPFSNLAQMERGLRGPSGAMLARLHAAYDEIALGGDL